MDPVRLVVKHTFLEFECNGQNPRGGFAGPRRRSDSKIEYNGPMLGDEDGQGFQAPSTLDHTVGPAATSSRAGVGSPHLPDTSASSIHSSLNDEDGELDGEKELDTSTRRGSIFSSVSRRNSFSRESEGHSRLGADVGVLEHDWDCRRNSIFSLATDCGEQEQDRRHCSLFGNAPADFGEQYGDRRRGSAFSVVTDCGDFMPPSLCVSQSDPWPRQLWDAVGPLSSSPQTEASPHFAAAPPLSTPLAPLEAKPGTGGAAAQQHLGPGYGAAGVRPSQPPVARQPPGAFGADLPSLAAPPGLADDLSGRRFSHHPMLQSPAVPPPYPQHQQHQQQQQQHQQHLQHPQHPQHPQQPQHPQHPQHPQQRLAAPLGCNGTPGHLPYYGVGGPPGYFGPYGWQPPMPQANGSLAAAQMPGLDAVCRSATGVGTHAGFGDPAYYNTQAQARTTVMLRNLPEGFARSMLIAILDEAGFAGAYDFVYMPMNFRTKSSFGYAFVNLVTPSVAQRCHDHFQGFSRWGVPTEKVCEVSWSDMHQGLTAHIHRYRNSPVMHESVPDEYKPVMYSCGVRVAFPPPTKKLRVPRIRRSPDSLLDDGVDDTGQGAWMHGVA